MNEDYHGVNGLGSEYFTTNFTIRYDIAKYTKDLDFQYRKECSVCNSFYVKIHPVKAIYGCVTCGNKAIIQKLSAGSQDGYISVLFTFLDDFKSVQEMLEK